MQAKVENVLQLRNNKLVQFNKFPRNVLNTVARQKVRENLRNQDTYTGFLCPGAKKRLIRCIENFVIALKDKWVENTVTGQIQPFRGSFVTLTVHSPDRMIDGREAYKTLLEPLLQWMRRKHGCTMYIWKAEYQQRGQLHYHITSDCFIHYKELRDKFNDLQKKAGYLDVYYRRKGHYNAPSTQIKARKKGVRDFASYLTKEFIKTYQNAKTVNGKVWDCSLNIKHAKYYTCNYQDYRNKIDGMIKSGEIKPVYTDHCAFFKLVSKPAYEILNYHDRLFFDAHIDEIKNRDWITIMRNKPKVETEIAQTKAPPKAATQLSLSLKINWN